MPELTQPFQRRAVKSERIYLAVPYQEREQAKALGARWDQKGKSWYAPTPQIFEKTKKWFVEAKRTEGEAKRDPVQEFSDWLRSKDMDLKGLAVMDGKWHRIAIMGEKEKNASYRGHLDGAIPNGILNNFKGGLDKWILKGHSLSKGEIARAIEAGKLAAKEQAAELQKTHEKVAKTAYGIWANLKDWANQTNCDYLKTKGVKGYGVRLDKDGRMVVPLRDTDFKLHNVQFVGEKKYFLEGGRKEGLFHLIDPKRVLAQERPFTKADTIILAEGYATGASVHQMVNKPVIVAFDGGNLVKVAKALREKFPEATFLIAGDNDHHLPLREPPLPNKGLEMAGEAAQAVGGFAITPSLLKVRRIRDLPTGMIFIRSWGWMKLLHVLSSKPARRLV